MTRSIVISAPAQRDLNQHFDYIGQDNPENALNFFDAARQTFASLARMPGQGSLYNSSDSRIRDLRKWHIQGFKNFLVFYRVQDESIEIVRIIYGTRDIETIMQDLR